MKLVVATPYPEGSTLAIARAAAATGSLMAMYASRHRRVMSGRLPSSVSRTLGLGRFARRKDLSGIPPHLVRGIAEGPELARAVISHIPGMQGLGSRTMYAGKMAFDRAVARELAQADAVLGIYGSAALTLRAAQLMGATRVLNFVNSHPAEHNRYLRELACISPSSHEFVPGHVARRVELELSLADLVLVPSHFVANQLLERGFPQSRLAVIPYGVDLEAFSPNADRSGNGRVRCLYVGQISHRKGISVLMRAADQLGDIEFILTGPVVSPFLLHGLPRNVRWLSPMTHREVADLMRLSDIFVLPSLEDSYGLVVPEAMASGLPVIVTDHVGAKEAIEHGVNGLVVPAGDAVALGSALRRLAENPNLRSRLGHTARESVAVGLSWAQYGDRAMLAIEQALHGGRAG